MAKKKQDGRKPGSGGRRKNAGRKPNYMKRLGCQPIAAAALLSTLDEEKFIKALLHDKSADVRLRTWITLRESVFGKPKQAMQFSGGIGVAHFAELSDAELEAQLKDLEAKLGVVPIKQLEAGPDSPEILPSAEEKTDAPKPGPWSVTATEMPEPPKPYGQALAEPKSAHWDTPHQVPPAIVPAEAEGFCDAHGRYRRDKRQSVCPRCAAEWAQQSRDDERKLGNLLPGEPMWNR